MSNVSFKTLETEFLNSKTQQEKIEESYKKYQVSLKETLRLEADCCNAVSTQKRKLGHLSEAVERYSPENEEKQRRDDILSESRKMNERVLEVEANLPGTKNLYLRIVLGSVNVQFPSQERRFKYKEQYEKFKLAVNGIILFITLLDLLVAYRAIDSILHFLLVWYNCTLTIRESILIVNGSRIKGWWRFHQFILLTNAGLMIVWPDGWSYDRFRSQFLYYIAYTSVLQFLQFYYQQGCLYRLRALGERYEMDVSISGFHSWMWKGLSYLLPFLYLGYCFQFYNAIVLYRLSRHENCTEWQVPAIAASYLLLFLGSIFTTSLVIHQKHTDDNNSNEHLKKSS